MANFSINIEYKDIVVKGRNFFNRGSDFIPIDYTVTIPFINSNNNTEDESGLYYIYVGDTSIKKSVIITNIIEVDNYDLHLYHNNNIITNNMLPYIINIEGIADNDNIPGLEIRGNNILLSDNSITLQISSFTRDINNTESNVTSTYYTILL